MKKLKIRNFNSIIIELRQRYLHRHAQDTKFSYSLNKLKRLKIMAKKQIEALKSVESSGKKQPAIKKLISERILNTEFLNELENNPGEWGM